MNNADKTKPQADELTPISWTQLMGYFYALQSRLQAQSHRIL